MRRGITVTVAALALVLSTGVPATAESVTVPGTGDITEMFADNARRSVVVKVFGLPGPCETRNVEAYLTWRGSQERYIARAGCIGGTTWVASLEYAESAGHNPVLVECDGFRMSYNATGDFFRAFVPRACLPEAASKIRVYGEAVEYGSPTGGSAGPTRLLQRG